MPGKLSGATSAGARSHESHQPVPFGNSVTGVEVRFRPAWDRRLGGMLPGHDPVVWLRDPVPGAAVDDPDGAGRSRQRGGGAGASASGRGAAPAGASSGSAAGGSGGVGRVVAAVAAGAVGGVQRVSLSNSARQALSRSRSAWICVVLAPYAAKRRSG